MGFDPFTVALVGGIVSGVSAYKQYEAGKDAADATRRQADETRRQGQIAQRQADIQNARQMRAAVRQARIARASVVNTGANAGTLTSSGVTGGVSSIGSQLQSNLTTFNQLDQFNDEAVASQTAAGVAAADATIAKAESAQWGALGQLGGTVFEGAGGYKTIFK